MSHSSLARTIAHSCQAALLIFSLFFFMASTVSHAEEPWPDVQAEYDLKGEIKGIVFRVEFNNADEKLTATDAEMEAFFNGTTYDFTSPTNVCSVREYFRVQSAGKMDLTHVIAPKISLPQPRSYYDSAPKLLKAMVAQLKKDYPNFWTEQLLRSLTVHPKTNYLYITDDHDQLTGESGSYPTFHSVYIIVGGAEGSNASLYWPHWGAANTNEGSGLMTPVATLDGDYIGIYDHVIAAERFGGALFPQLNLVVHETAHMLSEYEDFYDTTGRSSGIGDHGLMGNNKRAELKTCPPPINPFCKFLSGWATFKQLPEHSQLLTLDPADTAYYIKVNPANRKEFYILEPRIKKTKTLTQSLYESGLVVWHVDLLQSNNNYVENPSAEKHYRLAVVQADGLRSLEGTWGTTGSTNDYFGNTYKTFSGFSSPTNSDYWNGQPSNLNLKNITINANSITLNSVNAYDENTFDPSGSTFSPATVLEGGTPFSLIVNYTGATPGTPVVLSLPNSRLKLAAGSSLTFTPTTASGTHTIHFDSIPVDNSRETGTIVSLLQGRCGEALFKQTIAGPLTIVENSPKLEMTAVPNKRIIRAYSDPLVLTISQKNANLSSWAEDRFAFSSQKLDISNPISCLTGEVLMETLPRNFSFTFSYSKFNDYVGKRLDSIDVAVGSGMTNGTTGIYYPHVKYTVKFSSPVFCSTNDNQMFMAMHRSERPMYFEREKGRLIVTYYNARANTTVDAPVIPGLGTPSPKQHTFTQNEDVAEVVYDYLLPANGIPNQGYESEECTVYYNDNVTQNVVYTVNKGAFKILDNEEGSALIPTTIALTAVPALTQYDLGEDKGITFTPVLKSEQQSMPSSTEIVREVSKDGAAYERLPDGIWSPNDVGNYTFRFSYAGNAAFAASQVAYTVEVIRKDGVGTIYNPMIITNAAEFQTFAQEVATGSVTGKKTYARIAGDFAITNVSLLPLTDYQGAISGDTTDDGAPKYTITLDTANCSGQNAFLFSNAADAQFENVNFVLNAAQNYTMNNEGCGILLGKGVNCTFKNISLTVNKDVSVDSAPLMSFGTLCGTVSGTTLFEKCKVDVAENVVISTPVLAESTVYTAGLCGRSLSGTANVKNCQFFLRKDAMFTTYSPDVPNLPYAGYNQYVSGLIARPGGTLHIESCLIELAGSLLQCGAGYNYNGKVILSGGVCATGVNTLCHTIVKMLPGAQMTTEEPSGFAGIAYNVETAENVWFIRPTPIDMDQNCVIPKGALNGSRSIVNNELNVNRYSNNNIYIVDYDALSAPYNGNTTRAILYDSLGNNALSTTPAGVNVTVTSGSLYLKYLSESAKIQPLANALEQPITLSFSRESMPDFLVEFVANVSGLSDPELPEKHHLTVVNGTGSGDYEEGEKIDITYTGIVPEHEAFSQWRDYKNNVVARTVSFEYTMPAYADTLMPETLTNEFPITIFNGADTFVLWKKLGEKITIVSVPDTPDSAFVKWIDVHNGNMVSEDTAYSFVITGEARCYAVFNKIQRVSILTVVNGTPNRAELYAGDTIVVTANEAIQHYRFKTWSNGVTDPVFTFTMPDTDITLQAHYEQVEFAHVLTVRNGTPDSMVAFAGDVVRITAKVFPNKNFCEWYKDSDYSKPYTKDSSFEFVMTDTDVYFSARFEVNKSYKLITYYFEECYIAPISYGREVTRTAKPVPGYKFLHWTDDKGQILTDSTTLTFIMPERAFSVHAIYLDLEFQFQLMVDSGCVLLTWLTAPHKAVSIYRSGNTSAPVKIGVSKTGQFIDNDPALRYNTRYTYYLEADNKKSETISMQMRPVHTDSRLMGMGSVFAIDVDAIALIENDVEQFEKPSFTVYYDDVLNEKNGMIPTRKIPLVTEKIQNVSEMKMFFRKEIPMFNAKAYKDALRKGILTEAFIADRQMDSIALYVTVKKCNKEYKNELRTNVLYYFGAPSIDSIFVDTNATFNPDSGLIVSLAADNYDIRVSGQRFGIKKPKAWVEYVDKGKVKKQTLKVRPLDQYSKNPCSLLTKSQITDEDGTSACLVTIPAKKWSADKAKRKLPTYASFVISTGKAMTAVPFKIKE